MGQLNAREGNYYGDINAQYANRLQGLNVSKAQGEQNLGRQRETETRQKVKHIVTWLIIFVILTNQVSKNLVYRVQVTLVQLVCTSML